MSNKVNIFAIVVLAIGLFSNNYIHKRDIKYLLDTVKTQQQQIHKLENRLNNINIKVSNISDTDIELPITEEEFNLIAKVVATEARGESYEGQKLVAQTIKNRSELWDKSIKEVIYAPGQYVIANVPVSKDVTDAVYDVFVNKDYVVDEPITHFCKINIFPSWGKYKTEVITEGNHKFYK